MCIYIYIYIYIYTYDISSLKVKRTQKIPSRQSFRAYTGCIKMIGAVWKLIIFTSMVNRLINTSRNERVTLKVYDTCLQIFDVCTLRHTAYMKAIVQFPPYSDQQIRCDSLKSHGNSVLQIRYTHGL